MVEGDKHSIQFYIGPKFENRARLREIFIKLYCDMRELIQEEGIAVDSVREMVRLPLGSNKYEYISYATLLYLKQEGFAEYVLPVSQHKIEVDYELQKYYPIDNIENIKTEYGRARILSIHIEKIENSSVALALGDYSDAKATNQPMTNHTENILNLEFNNCSVNLQGDLNSLATMLAQGGFADDAEFLGELTDGLKGASNVIPTDASADSAEMESVKKVLKKKGLLGKLESLHDELCDENSSLRKAANVIRVSVEALQNVASHYNKVAQWFALPQVPDIFLGKHGKKM